MSTRHRQVVPPVAQATVFEPSGVSGKSPSTAHDGRAPMMITVVPTGTSSYNCAISSLCIRMQPCEAYRPIDSGELVPWIRINPGAVMYRARVPIGLPGPPGITAGRSAPQLSSAGVYHVGFSALRSIVHSPAGVIHPGFAVATFHVLVTWKPS